MQASVAALLLMLLAASPPTEVTALVEQLGADTRAERDAASAALQKLGSRALPQLRQALASRDAEIRRRARRLLEQIQSELFHEVRQFKGHFGSVNAVSFSPSGKTLASGDSRSVRLWNPNTGQQLAEARDHADRIMALAFSPDGKTLASGSEDRRVRLWQADTLQALRECKGHTGDVRAVAFHPDGTRLYSAGRDRFIREWSITTPATQERSWKLNQEIFSLLVLPRKDSLLLGDADGLRQLDLSRHSDRAGRLLEGHQRLVMGLALSQDQKALVSACHDTTLRIWDVQTLQSRSFKSGEVAVTSVALSPDGKRAVAGTTNGLLQIWDVPTGQLIRSLRGHENAIWSLAYAPDGQHVASGGQDGTLRLWRVGD